MDTAIWCRRLVGSVVLYKIKVFFLSDYFIVFCATLLFLNFMIILIFVSVTEREGAMGNPLISIKNLKKNYGNIEVLKGIDLEINEGEIYGLIGQSGAGKSTLLRCINGLEEFDEGSLIVDDLKVDPNSKKIREIRKEMGMIFQTFSLISRKTVYENIELPLKLWGVPKENRKSRVVELANLVGMPDKLDKYPSTLSGGQKQRVGIARALALQPKILLLDEATSALDPATTISILDLLQDINEKLKITMVLVTHQIEVIKRLTNRVSILKNGRIVVDSDTKQLFLDQPFELMELTGDIYHFIPSNGYRLIKIFFEDYRNYEDLISNISADTGCRFNIVDIKLEYVNKVKLGYAVIEVKDAEYNVIIKNLSDNNVEWEVINE